MKKIDVSTKKHPNTFVMVDDEDYEGLSKYKWCLSHSKRNKYYVTRSIVIKMHHTLIDRIPGMVIDHIDGNTLNLQKSNLRVCSRQENCWNYRRPKKPESQSKYIGVTKGGYKKKPFRAWLTHNGKTIALGYFETEMEAALAYDKKSKELHGKFANLNF